MWAVTERVVFRCEGATPSIGIFCEDVLTSITGHVMEGPKSFLRPSGPMSFFKGIIQSWGVELSINPPF